MITLVPEASVPTVGPPGDSAKGSASVSSARLSGGSSTLGNGRLAVDAADDGDGADSEADGDPDGDGLAVSAWHAAQRRRIAGTRAVRGFTLAAV
jgi:hypothetical protein